MEDYQRVVGYETQKVRPLCCFSECLLKLLLPAGIFVSCMIDFFYHFCR